MSYSIQVNVTNQYGESHKLTVYNPRGLQDVIVRCLQSSCTFTVPNKRNYAWVDQAIINARETFSKEQAVRNIEAAKLMKSIFA